VKNPLFLFNRFYRRPTSKASQHPMLGSDIKVGSLVNVTALESPYEKDAVTAEKVSVMERQ